ncbi:peptidyl-tRNA hydrolase [Collibacillus ludicampi]|uniref:Peptidyl-tRNA hydrolase n=1 Tax=Collibacillus ludicampi TaxID=2771369 RepID=A0AAV4LEV0_9BACL|nr:aminoacyl-tRNA hydrolase [Collibacillus ludicampi]GIM46044.1 peptidyl-tRNA hydrolase [Collibacillus ludicampi]
MKIFVGLGNPGKEYEGTRHNIGFDVIDQAAKTFGIDVTKNKFQALYGEGIDRGEKIVLVRPMTYMNLSGQSVRALVDWYKPSIEDLIILYDDMDFPPGSLRLRVKGSAGGHNGIKSIISHLGTQEFYRIRIGIGRPAPGRDVINHVLSRFTSEERPLMEEAVKRAVEAMACILTDGFEKAMNQFNK